MSQHHATHAEKSPQRQQHQEPPLYQENYSQLSALLN